MTIEINEEEKIFLLKAINSYLNYEDESITNRIHSGNNKVAINQLHQKFDKIKRQSDILINKLNQ